MHSKRPLALPIRHANGLETESLLTAIPAGIAPSPKLGVVRLVASPERCEGIDAVVTSAPLISQMQQVTLASEASTSVET
jgi:hypothetical protein